MSVIPICALLAAAVFDRGGVFFEAKPGASIARFELPVASGEKHESADIEFSMHVGEFQRVFNSIISLNQPQKKNYFALQIRADKSKTLIDKMNETQYGEVAPWIPNTSYRVSIRYEAGRGRITFEATQIGGAFHQKFETAMPQREITDGVVLVFGLDRVYADAYYPPIGWRFSDLKVRLH